MGTHVETAQAAYVHTHNTGAHTRSSFSSFIKILLNPPVGEGALTHTHVHVTHVIATDKSKCCMHTWSVSLQSAPRFTPRFIPRFTPKHSGAMATLVVFLIACLLL